MEYKKWECKTALNHIKAPRLPYQWDLNIYRGCLHGCAYCFAMYSHEYLGESEYFQTIYYKENIVEVLEKKLKSKTWKKEVINIGGITDSYQPLEKEKQLMREVLKLMIRYQNPIIISTKSDLILRDLDLIKELSELTVVNIACTVTTVDEKIRSALEPNGSTSKNRLLALKRIKEETNAIVGIHIMPIIPYITSNDSNLKEIYRCGKKIGVDYILTSSLSLRGPTRKNFYHFLDTWNPSISKKIKTLYQNPELKNQYKKKLTFKIAAFEKEYGVGHNYQAKIKEKMQEFQIPLETFCETKKL